MRENYEPDTFTENDVLRCLDSAGLRYKVGRRYILSQCPTHDDTNPSVQIYKDDWFVNCHAGCGRYHITKAFPELRGGIRSANPRSNQMAAQPRASIVKYKQFDLMEYWKKLPLIPNDHYLKGIPIGILNYLGWRLDVSKNGYFIPYFSSSKDSIPFAQWRHLSGDRRFTMLKDAKPTCYGTWNLDNDKLFIVEGTSDCAVLQACAVPFIGLPSAASVELIKTMADYCTKNDIELVYAGDNDDAGDKLRQALDEVATYRVWQPPKEYKDWGKFFEAKGIDAVRDYCFKELGGYDFEKAYHERYPDEPNHFENIKKVWPDLEPTEIAS